MSSSSVQARRREFIISGCWVSSGLDVSRCPACRGELGSQRQVRHSYRDKKRFGKNGVILCSGWGITLINYTYHERTLCYRVTVKIQYDIYQRPHGNLSVSDSDPVSHYYLFPGLFRFLEAKEEDEAPSTSSVHGSCKFSISFWIDYTVYASSFHNTPCVMLWCVSLLSSPQFSQHRPPVDSQRPPQQPKHRVAALMRKTQHQHGQINTDMLVPVHTLHAL